MRIANQHAFIVLGGFILAGAACWLTSIVASTPAAVGVLVVLALGNIVVLRPLTWSWLWGRASARFAHALGRDDSDDAVALAERLAAEARTRGGREIFVASRGVALLMGDRWRDGIPVLRAVDRSLIPPELRILADNYLAWGLAHDGAVDEALTLARATAEAARTEPALDPVTRGTCIGTLGVALLRANMAEPALVHLREALALGGGPRTRAAHLLHIGDAEHALGRVAEARAAWAEAAELAPESRRGKTAAERLKSADPVPYR